MTVKRTLGGFKRTHHESWHDHKQKFTDDQLAILTELLVSPNYYAWWILLHTWIIYHIMRVSIPFWQGSSVMTFFFFAFAARFSYACFHSYISNPGKMFVTIILSIGNCWVIKQQFICLLFTRLAISFNFINLLFLHGDFLLWILRLFIDWLSKFVHSPKNRLKLLQGILA